MHGRTTVVIAHRLSTVMAADDIVVLDAGRVVERGRHATLLAREGLYAELVRTQMGESKCWAAHGDEPPPATAESAAASSRACERTESTT
jgi:ABC-type sugar transport system ATPase subunit